jgi:tRNA G18 (ribose-2'-O)-methylase SpoU
VVFADASVDPYNGKCVRASAGSLFHLPVVAGARLEDVVVTLREAGLRIVAADGRAGRSLDDPEVQARLAEPTAWMFGNEAWGLPPELVALADEPVAVPIYGPAESLNLAAAAAVCLYASARAQRVHREGRTARWVEGQDGTQVATGGLEYLGYNIENSRPRTVTKPVYALESDHNPSPKP